MILRALTSAIVVAVSPTAVAASITTTWLGGTGDWYEPTNWSGGVAPDNSATDSYDVIVDANGDLDSVVTLSERAIVSTLQVDAGDALVLTDGALLAFSGNEVRNAGLIHLQSPLTPLGTDMFFDQDGTVLSGGGSIRLERAFVQGCCSLTGLTNLDNFISGSGAMLTGSNYGVIQADIPGEVLDIGYAISSMRNGGTLRATNGGILGASPYVTIDNTDGAIEARDGGDISFSDGTFVFGGRVTAINSNFATSGFFSRVDFEADANSSIRFGGQESGGIDDTTLNGLFLGGAHLGGTNVLHGTWLGASFFPSGETTFVNHGQVEVSYVYAAGDAVLSLTGGGSVAISSGGATRAFDNFQAPIRNIDNDIRGEGRFLALLENSGLVEATTGLVQITGAPVDHRGLFAAAPGGNLAIETTVTGTGSWRADGGSIHITGNVGTTGDVEVRNGGSLAVETQMQAGNLLVDDTGSLDITGILRVAGDVDITGQDETRWSFGPSSALEIDGPQGAAIGDWSDWQSLEATGIHLFLQPVDGSGRGMYLPKLVIGSDGRLVLRDRHDNGNRPFPEFSGEVVWVDTLEFSDSLGILNRNGISIYYNHLVGSADQIIDVAVPEPGAILLLSISSALLLLRASRD